MDPVHGLIQLNFFYTAWVNNNMWIETLLEQWYVDERWNYRICSAHHSVYALKYVENINIYGGVHFYQKAAETAYFQSFILVCKLRSRLPVRVSASITTPTMSPHFSHDLFSWKRKPKSVHSRYSSNPHSVSVRVWPQLKHLPQTRANINNLLPSSKELPHV